MIREKVYARFRWDKREPFKEGFCAVKKNYTEFVTPNKDFIVINRYLSKVFQTEVYDSNGKIFQFSRSEGSIGMEKSPSQNIIDDIAIDMYRSQLNGIEHFLHLKPTLVEEALEIFKPWERQYSK